MKLRENPLDKVIQIDHIPVASIAAPGGIFQAPARTTESADMSTIAHPFTAEIAQQEKGIACTCGGYAEIVPCTDEERAKYGCGRNYDCCSRAFVCRLCGTRYAGSTSAPEME